MDWDKRIADVEGEDEVDITLTSPVPAVPGFLPELIGPHDAAGEFVSA